jgi:predicted dehydrogenase
MKVLIIGMGSIARKHIHALQKIDSNAIIYAMRSGQKDHYGIENIHNLFEWTDVPSDIDFILVSNPTSFHYETIQTAIKLNKPLFIEKPPLQSLEGSEELIKLISEQNLSTYVAFNMRFHPVITWLKENINVNDVVEVQAYCGSYLPDWRPGRNYKEVYSAQKAYGGGVHLDLIHEIDFIKWIFGKPHTSSGFISNVSHLEIDSSDCAHYWLSYPNYNISIILNYYRRVAKRQIEIVTHNDILLADLLNYTITNSKEELLFSCEPNVLISFEKQMQYFIESIQSNTEISSNFTAAIETLKISLIQ